jgi:CubicO group peptidase (beta-lactamase class C family)
MKRLVVATVSLLISLGAGTPGGLRAQQASPDPTEAEIDEIFARFKDGPGCALGVIRDGGLVFTRGYGYANLDHDVPISSTTIFDIGSTSKQFTAAAIVLLAQRGELSLDQDVRDFIPELHEYDEPITVRQLIHHTSGVRDYLTLMRFAGMSFENVFQEDDGVELLARQRELNFEPNTDHLYSNSGYLLLAVIVRRISGMSIGEFLEQEVFGPLGMEHTFVYEDRFRVVEGRATGYASDGEGGFRIEHFFNFELGGDGQVYTSVEDLLLWDRNFYDPVVGGPEFLQQLHTRGVLDDGDTLTYAFGLGIREYRGLPSVSHGGAWGGFRAELVRFPEQRFSVVCLCNVGNANAGGLARRVADLYLADQLAPEPAAGREGVERTVVAVSEDELERVTGYYWSSAYSSSRRILVSEGKLMYQRSPGNESALGPLGGDRFVMLNAGADVVVSFEPAGMKPERMIVVVDGDEPSVYKAYEPVALSSEDLTEYAGQYHSMELDTDYNLRVSEGRLLLQTAFEEQAELQPATADVFAIPAFGLTLHVRRDTTGAIEGFGLDAGRVKNLRFDRI